MRDEFFENFIDEFGDATKIRKVSATAIKKWRGKLPEILLTYWQNEGWNSYYNGLFTIVDPDEYEGVGDAWLEGSYLEGTDTFHAIAINGFGNLYLCGEKTGQSVVINPVYNTVFVQKKALERKHTNESLNISIKTLFGFAEINDHNKKGLFEQAVKKYGSLGEREIFIFEPALIAGGRPEIKYIHKADALIHLLILLEFDEHDIEEIDV